MGSFRLKNFYMQEDLDDLSGGDFSKKLTPACKRAVEKKEKKIVVRFTDDASVKRFTVEFSFDEVIENGRYRRRYWNKFPEVLPYENVKFWCRTTSGEIVLAFMVTRWINHYWFTYEDPRRTIECTYFYEYKATDKAPPEWKDSTPCNAN